MGEDLLIFWAGIFCKISSNFFSWGYSVQLDWAGQEVLGCIAMHWVIRKGFVGAEVMRLIRKPLHCTKLRLHCTWNYIHPLQLGCFQKKCTTVLWLQSCIFCCAGLSSLQSGEIGVPTVAFKKHRYDASNMEHETFYITEKSVAFNCVCPTVHVGPD